MATDPAAIVGLVTAPPAFAKKIARELVVRRLAACVNVVADVDSVYWWDGAVQEDSEALLIVKTTDVNVDPILELLEGIHPYETFEFVSMQIADGNPGYLGWIAESVTTAPPRQQ
jgi:periplasmic divalent cation tolerance protein